MKKFMLILLLFCGTANAAETLTLEQAQKIALQNHPQISSADFKSKAANEDINIQSANLLPQISGNAVGALADAGTRIAATNGLNDPTVLERGSAGISASQLITDFGRTDDLVEASKLAYMAAEQKTNLTHETILLNVTKAYYNVLSAKALLKVAEGTLKARKDLFEQVSSLRDSKMKSDLDANIAKQMLDEGNLLELKAKSNVEDSYAILSEALGYAKPKEFDLADPKNITSPPADVDEITKKALELNPELAALKAEKEAAEKYVDAEEKREYPTVSALGYAGATPLRNSGQYIDSNYAVAGINISIPFYTGGRITADEHKAAYNASAAVQDYEVKRNTLVRDIHMAFNNVKTAYENIDVTSQIEKNAAEGLDLTKTRYDIGKSSIIELNQAQLTATQAEIANADAKYKYLLGLAVLRYQSGIENN